MSYHATFLCNPGPRWWQGAATAALVARWLDDPSTAALLSADAAQASGTAVARAHLTALCGELCYVRGCLFAAVPLASLQGRRHRQPAELFIHMHAMSHRLREARWLLDVLRALPTGTPVAALASALMYELTQAVILAHIFGELHMRGGSHLLELWGDHLQEHRAAFWHAVAAARAFANLAHGTCH